MLLIVVGVFVFCSLFVYVFVFLFGAVVLCVVLCFCCVNVLVYVFVVVAYLGVPFVRYVFVLFLHHVRVIVHVAVCVVSICADNCSVCA